jgi:hypothetical protein
MEIDRALQISRRTCSRLLSFPALNLLFGTAKIKQRTYLDAREDTSTLPTISVLGSRGEEERRRAKNRVRVPSP